MNRRTTLRQWSARATAAAACAAAALTATACSVELVEGDEAPAASDDTVRWDLREPRPLSELGDTSGMVVVSSTGGARVDTEVQLPDGTVIDGTYADVVALEDHSTGNVSGVTFNAAHVDTNSWEPLVDDFITVHGGDRDAVAAHIDASVRALNAGDVALGRSFDGDPDGSVQPAIWVRVLGEPGDLVVSVRTEFHWE